MEHELLLVIATVFMLVGIAITIFLLLKIKKALASKHWPTALGELESTELRQVIYRGVDSQSASDQASALVVDFSYRYVVKGDSYLGKRVTFSDAVNKTQSALKKLQKLYQGKKSIKVFYNPQNPAESVLVPGVSLFNFTPLITSSLFILIALFLYNLKL